MTVDKVDMYRYIELGFYDKVWFNYNYSLYPSEPGRWLGILHWKGRLMCYHIITHTGGVILICTEQQVTNIELSTDEVKEKFLKFDA